MAMGGWAHLPRKLEAGPKVLVLWVLFDRSLETPDRHAVIALRSRRRLKLARDRRKRQRRQHGEAALAGGHIDAGCHRRRLSLTSKKAASPARCKAAASSFRWRAATAAAKPSLPAATTRPFASWACENQRPSARSV